MHLEAPEGRVSQVRLDNQDLEVHEATQETLERPDHREALVHEELPATRDSQEVLALPVLRELLVLQVGLARTAPRVRMVSRVRPESEVIQARQGHREARASVAWLDYLDREGVQVGKGGKVVPA